MSADPKPSTMGQPGKVNPETFVVNDVKDGLYGVTAKYNRRQTQLNHKLSGEMFGIRIQIPRGPHAGYFMEYYRSVTGPGEYPAYEEYSLYNKEGQPLLKDATYGEMVKYAENNVDMMIKSSMSYAVRMLNVHIRQALAIGNLKNEKHLLYTPLIKQYMWLNWRIYNNFDPTETFNLAKNPPNPAPWLDDNSDFSKFYQRNFGNDIFVQQDDPQNSDGPEHT